MKFKRGDKIMITRFDGDYNRLRYEQERRGYLEIDSIYHGLDHYVAFKFVGIHGPWSIDQHDVVVKRFTGIPKPKEFKLKKLKICFTH